MVFQGVTQATYLGAHLAAESDEERAEIVEAREHTNYKYTIDQAETHFQRQNLRDQRAVWEREALRKTDLFPGRIYQGIYIF